MPIHMCHFMTKPTKWLCAQRRLRSAWACAQWVAKDPSFLRADNEDSDQIGRMPRLILVFAGRTVILLILSRGGSYVLCSRPFQKWVLKEPAHEIMVLITPGGQRKLRQACTSAQSRQSLFAHMTYGSRQTVRPKLYWMVWRMSLRRTESAIISWHDSNA